MLLRILEPEVMDTHHDAEAYDRMDHAAVNARFVDDLLCRLRPNGDQVVTALDLGTGTAQIPIALCQRVERCHVTAVDAADSMIALARQHLEESRLIDRITLVHADAKRLPRDIGSFDVVMSNSLVHHLADPSPMLAGALSCTKPGGMIFVRDLLRPNDTATLDQLVETYAGNATTEQRQLFAKSLHAALTLDEVRGLVAAIGFPAETVEQTSDRHWTWMARRASDPGSAEES
jgi:ubiquinone/menaquinone biosynthesis C-methylase UbiE